jgi:hypothetical protein
LRAGRANPSLREGTLLQLIACDAVEEFDCPWLETKQIKFGNCKEAYIAKPNRKRRRSSTLCTTKYTERMFSGKHGNKSKRIRERQGRWKVH